MAHKGDTSSCTTVFFAGSLAFKDATAFDLTTDGSVLIKDTVENVHYSQEGKPSFRNDTTGETVVEYTGLATDKREDRSWARAFFDKGGFSPLHYHNDRVEIYYIIKGVAEVTLDGTPYILVPGEHIVIHPRQQHQVKSVDSEDHLEMIVKCSPSWIYEDQHLVASPL